MRLPARVCILGSTGSVGTSTLDVLARHPERFEVHALTAHSRVDELAAQCLQWHELGCLLLGEAAGPVKPAACASTSRRWPC